MTKNNQPEEYPLSIGEQKLIEQIRDLQDKDSKRPMMVTVRLVDGIWQIFESVPRGIVKT